jgi:hypothetical protein
MSLDQGREETGSPIDFGLPVPAEAVDIGTDFAAAREQFKTFLETYAPDFGAADRAVRSGR